MAESNINRDFRTANSGSPRPAPRFRFDGGAKAGAESGSGRSRSLLGIFGVFGGPAARPRLKYVPERRATDRVHHVECLAWVGWKKFRGFSMNDAVLVDISRGGARIFLDNAPPAEGPVWIFLETPDTNAIVRARMVSTETTKHGQCVLRVEFEEHCPYQFFEAAVCGLAASNPKARMAVEPRVRALQGSSGLAG